MDTLLTWLVSNREWVFGGIGVAALTFFGGIIRYFLGRSSKVESKRVSALVRADASGDHSVGLLVNSPSISSEAGSTVTVTSRDQGDLKFIETLLSNNQRLQVENGQLHEERIKGAKEALSAQQVSGNGADRISEAERELANGNVSLAAAIYTEVAERQLMLGRLHYKEAGMAFSRLGTLLSQNRLPDAISAYEKSSHTDPNRTETWNELGHLYMKQGRLADALEAFEAAIALSDDVNGDCDE